MIINLYPHQQEAVDKLKSGSILCGGVGSGKSLTSVYYYFCKECGGSVGEVYKPMTNPKPLYIITTAMKRDALDWGYECVPFLIEPTIDSWNNVKKYENVKDSFFIFDEQRVVGSGAWVKAFLKIAKNNKWILLSATPGDTYMDYIPVLIANGYYRNRSEFIDLHVEWDRFAKYPKVKRYHNTKRLDIIISSLLVDMPFSRATTRHYLSIETEFDKQLYDKIMIDRWDPFDDKPITNMGDVCRLLRKVVNSDVSKINVVEELHSNFPRLIIFYNFNYELEALRKMCDDNDYMYAEWNGQLHEKIPNTKEWIYLVQYTAGAEGWNCVETNCIIFFSQNYSYKATEQAAGRIDRLNTKYIDLYYYTLKSNSSIDIAINKSLEKKEDFNEKMFLNS